VLTDYTETLSKPELWVEAIIGMSHLLYRCLDVKIPRAQDLRLFSNKILIRMSRLLSNGRSKVRDARGIRENPLPYDVSTIFLKHLHNVEPLPAWFHFK
jgi:hypothetical protein